MTPTPETFMPSPRGRLVLWAMAVFFIALFIGAFAYRLNNPSMTVAGNPQSHGQDPAQAQMGDPDMDAIGALMRRVSEHPEDMNALVELSDRFLQMGSWDNARTFLEQAVMLEPGNTHVLFMLGVCLFQMGEPSEAADYFAQIVEIDPDDLQAKFNLAVIYKHDLDRKDESRALFQEIIDDPDAPQELVADAQEQLEL